MSGWSLESASLPSLSAAQKNPSVAITALSVQELRLGAAKVLCDDTVELRIPSPLFI